jgi:hypothetical protein
VGAGQFVPPKVESQKSYFHFASQKLGAGSVILPGNWGRIVSKLGWQHSHAIREAALEASRAANFAHAPSRMECVFLFFSQEDAERYRKQSPLGILHRVTLVDQSTPVFQADLAAFPPNIPYRWDWCDTYWSRNLNRIPPVENTLLEGLTLSAVTVEECLE